MFWLARNFGVKFKSDSIIQDRIPTADGSVAEYPGKFLEKGGGV